MEKIIEILNKKQFYFNIIEPDCTVKEALCRMSSQKTEFLIVTDESNNFLGLLTEHDITSKTFFLNQLKDSLPVKDIMNTRLPVADTSFSPGQCLELMKRHHVHYLPIFEGKKFMGVISIDDILDIALQKREELYNQPAFVI
jgi:CBS domain-containing protein